MIRYCETKQFRRKIVKTTPSLIPNNFRYPKLFETQKGSFTKWFGTARHKLLTKNRDTPSLPYPQHFSKTEINETLKDSSTKVYGTVRQKKWWEIVILPPSCVGKKNFNTRNFLKDSRVHLRTDSVLWDKTILTENRETHPSLIPNIFRYPKLFETQKGSFTKWFGTVRQKILRENRETHLLSYP